MGASSRPVMNVNQGSLSSPPEEARSTSGAGSGGTHVPRVSVLMTYYNKGEYVEEAVRSVLASTFTDFELLVVDDASTDGGLDLVRNFRDTRIRILESDVNTGRAAAANRGYEAALGEYIAILDADDVMGPDRLAKQVSFMDTHPEIGALGTYATELGTDRLMGAWKLTDRECRGTMLLGDAFCYGSSMLRASVIREHGIRSDANWRLPGEDYLFMISLSKFTKFANLSESLTYYRLGEQNQRYGRDPVADRGALFMEAFRRFGFPVTSEQMRLYLMLHRLFSSKPVAQDVHDLRKFLDDLIEWNRKCNIFPADVFEEALETRWSRLFHRFCEFGVVHGWVHLSISKAYTAAKLYYLLRQAIDRTLGTVREDPLRLP